MRIDFGAERGRHCGGGGGEWQGGVDEYGFGGRFSTLSEEEEMSDRDSDDGDVRGDNPEP
jgi:hypothetical protein